LITVLPHLPLLVDPITGFGEIPLWNSHSLVPLFVGWLFIVFTIGGCYRLLLLVRGSRWLLGLGAVEHIWLIGWFPHVGSFPLLSRWCHGCILDYAHTLRTFTHTVTYGWIAVGLRFTRIAVLVVYIHTLPDTTVTLRYGLPHTDLDYRIGWLNTPTRLVTVHGYTHTHTHIYHTHTHTTHHTPFPLQRWFPLDLQFHSVVPC